MRTLIKTNQTSLRLLILALISSGWVASTASAQWVAYTFSPRAAYLSSYGLNTNANNASTNIATNGWVNATTAAGTFTVSDVNTRGVIALYFSTNTNSPNFIVATQPLFYTYGNNANLLSTNNFATNYGLIQLTNTNVTDMNAALNTNVWYYNRTRFGTSTRYLAGQYVLSGSNTNAVGSFNSVAIGYTTNQIRRWFPIILRLSLTNLPLKLVKQIFGRVAMSRCVASLHHPLSDLLTLCCCDNRCKTFIVIDDIVFRFNDMFERTTTKIP